MGKNLAKIIFGAGLIVTASLVGYGVGKKNIWYQIGGIGTLFITTTTSVIVGSRYQPKDNQDDYPSD